jgi:hypothetical protein
MTSGWIIWARSKPDSDTIGVFVIPPGTRTLMGTVEVLRCGTERSSAALVGGKPAGSGLGTEPALLKSEKGNQQPTQLM